MFLGQDDLPTVYRLAVVAEAEAGVELVSGDGPVAGVDVLLEQDPSLDMILLDCIGAPVLDMVDEGWLVTDPMDSVLPDQRVNRMAVGAVLPDDETGVDHLLAIHMYVYPEQMEMDMTGGMDYSYMDLVSCSTGEL